jgi:hypothetical protein
LAEVGRFKAFLRRVAFVLGRASSDRTRRTHPGQIL